MSGGGAAGAGAQPPPWPVSDRRSAPRSVSSLSRAAWAWLTCFCASFTAWLSLAEPLERAAPDDPAAGAGEDGDGALSGRSATDSVMSDAPEEDEEEDDDDDVPDACASSSAASDCLAWASWPFAEFRLCCRLLV